MKVQSKYVDIPVMRGFQEIEALYTASSYHGCMILGGYVRYMASQRFNPDMASDVDVFPQSEDGTRLILEHLKSLGFTVHHENEISVTLEKPKDCPSNYVACPRIQIIKPVTEGAIVTVGMMTDVLDNFDFTIVRCGLINPRFILADEEFIQHEKTRQIKLKNIHCPVSSTLRVVKYSKKGYWCGPTEVAKLFTDWDERGDDYKRKLLDLISKMKPEDGTEPSKEEIEELEKLMNID